MNTKSIGRKLGDGMGYREIIEECNRHDLGKFRRFMVAGQAMGWVRHDLADRLVEFPRTFVVSEDAVAMHPDLTTAEARTQGFQAAAEIMEKTWGTPKLRGELYPVARRWGQVPLMLMDRAMVVVFGVPSHGVHVNGLVRRDDGLHLWIGSRALDKAVAPGKLDNMIAGGQPYNLSLQENLVKEAAEEADVDESLARTARPVGLITYVREDDWGLRPDVMFCFDLEVPQDFNPRNTDGEITHFTLMPVDRVARLVRDTLDFKLNVNLVIIDFLVRHGMLRPDNEPDYVDIVRGLRQYIGE